MGYVSGLEGSKHRGGALFVHHRDGLQPCRQLRGAPNVSYPIPVANDAVIGDFVTDDALLGANEPNRYSY